MISTLVSLLILILVIGLVVGIGVWLIQLMGLPEPFGRVAIAILALIALIVVLVYALPLAHLG